MLLVPVAVAAAAQVREAEKRIAGHKNMEYLPIGGFGEFCDLSVRTAFPHKQAFDSTPQPGARKRVSVSTLRSLHDDLVSRTITVCAV